MNILRQTAILYRPAYITMRSGDRIASWEGTLTPFTDEFTDEFGTPDGGIEVGRFPAFFQMRNSSEDSDHRDRQTVKGRLFLAPDVPVTSINRVGWAETGQRFEIVGPPRLICRPAGPHHFEIDVREVYDARVLLPA